MTYLPKALAAWRDLTACPSARPNSPHEAMAYAGQQQQQQPQEAREQLQPLAEEQPLEGLRPS